MQKRSELTGKNNVVGTHFAGTVDLSEVLNWNHSEWFVSPLELLQWRQF
jgi:hypothetical protein